MNASPLLVPRAGVDRSFGPALDVAIAAVNPRSIPGARRWWVTADGTAVEVHVTGAPQRTAPATDATLVAAGTAVLATRLAMTASGFRPVTTLLPSGRQPRGHQHSVLAIVRRGAAAIPRRVERVLFTALLAGAPPQERPPVPVAAVRRLLRGATDAEGVQLRTAATPDERAALLTLLATRSAPPDGLLALVGTPLDLPVSRLQAGQGLQRLLCTATALGLAGTVLAGPRELVRARERARSRSSVGVIPQVLVHVGQPARSSDTAPGPPERKARQLRAGATVAS